MPPKKPITKRQLNRLRILINDFIDGKTPNYLIRNYQREYRRHNCPNALLKNPMVNGVGGSWIEE